MKKDKLPLIVLIISFLIGIVGGTIAYFKNETKISNEFNLAKYDPSSIETFESPSNWRAGETIPKVITTTNNGTIPVAVRISYTEKWTDSNDNDLNISDAVTIHKTNEDMWIKDGNFYYYKYIVKPGSTVKPFMSGVTLNEEVGEVTCTQPDVNGEQVCESLDDTSGSKYTLTIKVETADSDYYKKIWNTDFEIVEYANPIQFVNRQNPNSITTGDLVKIGNTEEFYVVSSNEEETVLLAKYNINVGDHKNPAVQEGIQDISINGGQSDSSPYGYVSFSSGKYWTMGNYPGSYEDPNYPYVYDANSLVYPYVEAYKEMLEAEDVLINKARLLSYQEAKSLGCSNGACDNAPSWVYSSSYWLGSAQYSTRIWGIKMDRSFSALGYGPSVGVRPVIVVATADILE